MTEQDKEAMRAYHRAWRAKNPGKAAEYQRAHFARDPERRRAEWRERAKRWREANPEKAKAASLRGREKRRGKAREATRAWKAANPEKVRTARVRRYGITLEQVVAMREAQGGACAICRCDLKSGKGTTIDHCHATQSVRGLLCANCNFAIGHFKDNPESCVAAAAYLEAHRGR